MSNERARCVVTGCPALALEEFSAMVTETKTASGRDVESKKILLLEANVSVNKSMLWRLALESYEMHRMLCIFIVWKWAGKGRLAPES